MIIPKNVWKTHCFFIIPPCPKRKKIQEKLPSLGLDHRKDRLKKHPKGV
jgi:hypothetical protein